MDGWAVERRVAGQMSRRQERCWLHERLAEWGAGKMDNAWMDDRWTDGEDIDGRKHAGQMGRWTDGFRIELMVKWAGGRTLD